jgi:hypothetical protein
VVKGAVTGPDIGRGNYGTVVCTTCQSVNHIVSIVKDANLIIVVCPGCGEISAAFKIDASANPADIEREVSGSSDVAGMLETFRKMFNLVEPPKTPLPEN